MAAISTKPGYLLAHRIITALFRAKGDWLPMSYLVRMAEPIRHSAMDIETWRRLVDTEIWALTSWSLAVHASTNGIDYFAATSETVKVAVFIEKQKAFGGHVRWETLSLPNLQEMAKKGVPQACGPAYRNHVNLVRHALSGEDHRVTVPTLQQETKLSWGTLTHALEILRAHGHVRRFGKDILTQTYELTVIGWREGPWRGREKTGQRIR